jgi:uncharacterized GH25 family protein
MKLPLRPSIYLLLLLSSAALPAHDFWIEPSTYRPGPGQKVAVRLRVGERFSGQPVPRMESLTRRLVARFNGSETPLPGVPNTDPAGFFSSASAGVHTLVYESGLSSVELDGAKFETYLAEEGLEAIQKLRAKRGQRAAPAKEVFSRSVKSFVVVGGSTQGFADSASGLPLELIAESSPLSLSSAKSLRLQLLFRGKPLAGAKVVAFPRRDPLHQLAARTDAKGRAVLPLDAPDVWLVKAVHMIEAPPATKAQWESFWAILTFEVGPG